MNLKIANTRTPWADRAFVLWFGAYGSTYVLAFARHVEDALDECVDWIADNAPGLLCDDQVADEYQRLEAEWRERHPGEEPDDDMISKWQETAEEDTTSAGNNGHYLLSWEWGIVLADAEPTELGIYVSELRAHGL